MFKMDLNILITCNKRNHHQLSHRLQVFNNLRIRSIYSLGLDFSTTLSYRSAMRQSAQQRNRCKSTFPFSLEVPNICFTFPTPIINGPIILYVYYTFIIELFWRDGQQLLAAVAVLLRLAEWKLILVRKSQRRSSFLFQFSSMLLSSPPCYSVILHHQ